MAAIDGQLIGIADDMANVNVVKDIVLERLKTDGLLTEEQLNLYRNEWHIVIIKKGWFKNIKDRLGMSNPEAYFYKYVNFKI